MKLSELKALVAHLETGVLATNPDPEIQFWLARAGIEEVGPKDSPHFLQVAPFDNVTDFDVSMHRVCVSTDNLNVMSQNGDFHLPAMVRPFYR